MNLEQQRAFTFHVSRDTVYSRKALLVSIVNTLVEEDLIYVGKTP